MIKDDYRIRLMVRCETRQETLSKFEAAINGESEVWETLSIVPYECDIVALQKKRRSGRPATEDPLDKCLGLLEEQRTQEEPAPKEEETQAHSETKKEKPNFLRRWLGKKRQ